MPNKLHEILARHDLESEKRHAARMKRARELRDGAARFHQHWLEKQETAALQLENYECNRALVRQCMATMLDPQRCGGASLEDLLWQTIRYCAGALACFDLENPIDLKLRRLGRSMKTEQIDF